MNIASLASRLWTIAGGHHGRRARCVAMLDLLAAAHQPFSAAEAAALGAGPNQLTRLVRAGRIQRVGHGMFVTADVWATASPEQRHLLRAQAVLRRYDDAALSHVSAVIAHGLPVVGADLRAVHITRTREAGRSGATGRRPPVQVHPPLVPEAFAAVGGLPACTEAVAALQAADWHGTKVGLVAAEAGLHRGSIAPGELAAARSVVRLGRGRRAADAVVRLAAPHSESPGETLTRLLLLTLGEGAVVQQAPIPLIGGGSARVDFLLADSGVVVEFDGAVKYGGAEGRDALVREKRREDAIRAAGHPVVRLTRPDLDRPVRVRAMLVAAGAAQHSGRHRAPAGPIFT